MKKFFKFIKRKFGNGFTFMIVPNSSSGRVKSCVIPFSVALIVVSIIICNIYTFFGYTVQIKQIYNNNRKIHKLISEQREVKPTLNRSYQMAERLSRLEKENDRLMTTWRAIQQKGGRGITQTSRGVFIRTHPYILQPHQNQSGVKTSLTELNSNLKQIAGFIEKESQTQKELFTELLAYEQKLDHTPSIWPVESFTITSLFGFRRHPIQGFYKQHTGVDLQADFGTRVKATADGTIKFAGWLGGYGNAVIIDHGYGYETLYGHNSKLLVYQGQAVKKGQVISLSGSTGESTGPHLHYEVHIDGNPVNPVSFLRN